MDERDDSRGEFPLGRAPPGGYGMRAARTIAMRLRSKGNPKTPAGTSGGREPVRSDGVFGPTRHSPSTAAAKRGTPRLPGQGAYPTRPSRWVAGCLVLWPTLARDRPRQPNDPRRSRRGFKRGNLHAPDRDEVRDPRAMWLDCDSPYVFAAERDCPPSTNTLARIARQAGQQGGRHVACQHIIDTYPPALAEGALTAINPVRIRPRQRRLSACPLRRF